MRSPVGFAFILMLLLPIMVFIPDLIVYGTWNYKANAVVEQVTKEAEMVGGITPEVESRMQQSLKEYGLEGKGFTATYDRTGLVEHRGRFVVELKGKYTFKGFNIMGSKIGHFSLPITSIDSGMSEVWIR